MNTAPQPPEEGKVAGWVNIIKGLTLTNVLIIALMAMVAVPVYFAYRVLNDPAMLDRFTSSYDEEVDAASGCTVHALKEFSGPHHWAVSTGFAFRGSDRYMIAVVLNADPKPEAIAGYCTALNLMADKMQGVQNAK